MFKKEFRSRLMDYGLFPASLFLRLTLILAGFAEILTPQRSRANPRFTSFTVINLYKNIHQFIIIINCFYARRRALESITLLSL